MRLAAPATCTTPARRQQKNRSPSTSQARAVISGIRCCGTQKNAAAKNRAVDRPDRGQTIDSTKAGSAETQSRGWLFG